jgi:hypothetical protein
MLPAASFRHAWGEPDRIEHDPNGSELWIYHRGIRWNGFFAAFIVVPIGFAWPAGFDAISLVVENGAVSEAQTVCGGNLRFSFWWGPPQSSCSEPYSPTWATWRETSLDVDPMFIESENR